MTQAPQPPAFATGVPARTSQLAIWSLVLGILGLCLAFPGIVGLILGICGLVAIAKSNGRLGGKGLAIAGIITSSLALLWSCLLSIGLLLPALGQARAEIRNEMAIEAFATVGQAIIIYEREFGELPEIDRWPQALAEQGYISDDVIYEYPGDRFDGRMMSVNDKLRLRALRNVPSDTVLLFECAEGAPTAGSVTDLPPEPKSSRGFMIVFVDGRSEFILPAFVEDLRWDPDS